MSTKYKLNDWVFYNFKLVQITKIEGVNITGVSDGFFSTYGNYLNRNIVPLTLKNKTISDSFEELYNKIHSFPDLGWNYPDIHKCFIEQWMESCLTTNEENRKLFYRIVENLYKELDKKQYELLKLECNGIRLFKTNNK